MLRRDDSLGTMFRISGRISGIFFTPDMNNNLK
jgi:hypothetical protein